MFSFLSSISEHQEAFCLKMLHSADMAEEETSSSEMDPWLFSAVGLGTTTLSYTKQVTGGISGDSNKHLLSINASKSDGRQGCGACPGHFCQLGAQWKCKAAGNERASQSSMAKSKAGVRL